DRLETKIVEAPGELIFQVSGRHRVTAAYDFLGPRQTLVDHVLDHPRSRITRRLAVKWKEAGLSCDDDLVARELAGFEHLAQRGADCALASLKAVVDRGINYIAAKL